MRRGGGAVKEQGERRMQRTLLDKAPECPPSLARPSLGERKRVRVQPLPLCRFYLLALITVSPRSVSSFSTVTVLIAKALDSYSFTQ